MWLLLLFLILWGCAMVSFRRLNPSTWAQIRKVAAAAITPPVDETPDAFSFTAVTGVALSTEQTSNTITVAGLGSGVSVAASVSGGTYSKNGGAYVSSAGTAANGDTFAVRHTSSGTNSTAVTTTLTIGAVSAGFVSTTLAAVVDTTPDAFSFTDATGVALSSTQTSNTITVAGVNAPATVTITGGSYSKNGGGFVSTAGTAVNGDTFAVQHTASASNSTATNTVLTIGGVSDTFTSTTLAASGLDPSISAPTLTLATANTTYPPQFDIGLDDTAIVGDIIRLQWKLGSSDFTTPTGEATNAIDAGEASANAATFTGLSAISSGTHRFRSRVERGGSYGAWSNVVIQGPDDIAPELTLPTAASLGPTTGTLGVTTDTAEGTLYIVVVATNVQPTNTQIKAGQNSGGTAAVYAGNQAVSSSGAKTFSATGMTATTGYYRFYLHRDAAGNETVLAGGLFTTAAGGTSVAKLAIGIGETGKSADKSRYVDVQSDGFTFAANADVGVLLGVRSPNAMPAKAHVEMGSASFSGGAVWFGVTDSAVAFGPESPNPFPGNTDAGFRAQVNTAGLNLHANGSELAFAVGGTNDGSETWAWGYDNTNPAAPTFYVRRRASGGTVQTFGPVTLTSLIPATPTVYVAGANNGNGGVVNFGASAFLTTPETGHTGF